MTCGGDSVPVCLCVDLPPESASPVSSPSQQKASGRIRLCCKLRQWIKAARKAFAGAPTGGCCPSHGHLLSTWSETEAFKIRYIYIYIYLYVYMYIYTHIYIYIYIYNMHTPRSKTYLEASVHDDADPLKPRQRC